MKRLIFVTLTAMFMFANHSGAHDQSIMVKLVYNLPDSIAIITEPDDLRRFLDSDFILDRCRGVYKFGLIGNPSDINLIKDIYDKEPDRPIYTDELTEGVKYFALRAIANIGGSVAESTLLSLGDQVGGSSISDSLVIIKGLTESLRLLGTHASKEFLENYYNNSAFSMYSRLYALTNLMFICLNDSEVKTNADSIDFVLSFLPKSDSIGSEYTENYIKYEAVVFALLDTVFCNTQSITNLRARLNNFTDRPELHEQLQFVTDQIESYYNYNMSTK